MNKPIGENEVLLSGIAATDALPAHSSRGRNYFGFVLEVCRLSGATDRLNIIIPEDKLPPSGIHAGDSLTISGQIRSFNNKSGQGSRLVISVYVMSIADGGGEHENTVKLRGVICKPPVLRKTPLGREICDVMLAVNRRYGRADYLPVILWGRTALKAAEKETGDTLSIIGRIQSRNYIKTVGQLQEERVAFEVSAIELQEE